MPEDQPMDVPSDLPPQKAGAEWMMASLRTLDIALNFETTLKCEPLPPGDTLIMATLPDYHCRPEQFFPRRHVRGGVGFVASSSGVAVIVLAERICRRVLDRDLLCMQSMGFARVAVTDHDPIRNTVLCAVEFNVKALHGMLRAVILGQPDPLEPLILNWVNEMCAQSMAAHLINTGALNTAKLHHGALKLHIPVLMQQQQQKHQLVGSMREVEARILGRIRTPLYAYQLEALEWMLEVEARSLHCVPASSDTPFLELCEHADKGEDMWQPVLDDAKDGGGDKNRVWCNASSKKLCFGYAGHAPPGYDIYSRGGVLADEVGTGKTLEVLALIAASPLGAEAAADAAAQPVGISMHAGVPRLRSSATLIVCPSHLVAHWLKEMHKHVCAAWTVVKLVNRADVAAVTWSDILNANVVIASREMLIGTSYSKASLPGLTSRRAICRRKRALDTSARAAAAPGFPNTPGVALEAVRWRRLVVDEAHEGMQTYHDAKHTVHKSRISAMLAALPSDTRWYVSGTPMGVLFGSLHSIQDFLQATVRRVNWETPDARFDSDDSLADSNAIRLGAVFPDEPLFNAMFTRSLILRRTRESVAQEAAVPAVVQYVEWLDLTPTERAVYKARAAASPWNTPFLRRTCCSPYMDSGGGGSAIMPLAEVRELLLRDQQKLLSIKQEALLKCKQNLAGLQQVHSTLKASGHATPLIQPAIDALNLKLAMSECEDAQKEMDDIHRTMAFVRHAASEVSTSQACPVCLDDAHAKRAITRCGHSFCPPCILRAIETTHTCPNCRARLDARKDVFILDAQPACATTAAERGGGGDVTDAADQEAQEAQETQEWLEKYGAKSARLLRLTKAAGTSRFIIFSEFDDELARTGEVLNREGVHAAWCRGSVSCRNAAVAKFQEGMVKVLLLSARHCASGTDLSCADHVIVLGPLDGSSAEVSNMEAQALGRARRMGQHKTVKFIHFVARDTVEENIYNRHHHHVAPPPVFLDS